MDNYATQSQLDNLRQDVRRDINRLSDCVTDLIKNAERANTTQEKMAFSVEEITSILKKIELERVESKAKWKLFSDMKPYFISTLTLMVAFIIASQNTSDFFHWAKNGLITWAGI